MQLTERRNHCEDEIRSMDLSQYPRSDLYPQPPTHTRTHKHTRLRSSAAAEAKADTPAHMQALCV